MKSWGDLSYLEKCNIENGNVNRHSYSSGYTFEVKSKVDEAKKKAQEKKAKNDN